MGAERVEQSGELDELVDALLASRRYGRLLPAFVRSVARRELAAGRGGGAALKGAKGRLHRVVGSYRGGTPYADLLADLRGAAADGTLVAACRRAMAQHASTRERLPILERLYAEVLAPLGPLRSCVDLACGLHPLGLPWLPGAAELRYLACDVDLALVELLNGFFELSGIDGRALGCDLLESCPDGEFDVALLLKSLPCLEQLDRGAGLRLLRAVRARHVVVSFPVRSLGGRRKGMPAHYERHFLALVADEPWRVERLAFPSELVFVVRK